MLLILLQVRLKWINILHVLMKFWESLRRAGHTFQDRFTLLVRFFGVLVSFIPGTSTVVSIPLSYNTININIELILQI